MRSSASYPENVGGARDRWAARIDLLSGEKGLLQDACGDRARLPALCRSGGREAQAVSRSRSKEFIRRERGTRSSRVPSPRSSARARPRRCVSRRCRRGAVGAAPGGSSDWIESLRLDAPRTAPLCLRTRRPRHRARRGGGVDRARYSPRAARLTARGRPGALAECDAGGVSGSIPRRSSVAARRCRAGRPLRCPRGYAELVGRRPRGRRRGCARALGPDPLRRR